MLLTIPTILLIRNEIKRLASLNCFACSEAFPDWSWLHNFGCEGCPIFIVNMNLQEALLNLDLSDNWQTPTEIDQVKALIWRFW